MLNQSGSRSAIRTLLGLVAASALGGCGGKGSTPATDASTDASLEVPSDTPRPGGRSLPVADDGTDFLAADGGLSPPPPTSCDQGDTTLAYNAMPFGVVDCTNFSLGFEAVNVAEFGDEVQLAGSGAGITSLKVLMLSFGCQDRSMNGVCMSAPGATFSHPVTANIYAVDDTCAAPPCAGVRLGTVNQVVDIPFRPSADDVRCTGANAGKWFNPAAGPTGACKNGIATLQTFTFSSPIAVPADRRIIWTVAFNTTHAGFAPIGPTACNSTAAGCPYDSLNVGANSHTGAPYAGTDVDVDQAFVADSPSGPLEVNLGWTPFRPEGAIVTN